MEDYRSEARRRWQQQQQQEKEPAVGTRPAPSQAFGASSSTSSSAHAASSATRRSGSAGSNAGRPAGGAAASGDLLQEAAASLRASWLSLGEEQRTQVSAIGALALAFLWFGSQALPLLLGVVVALYLNAHLPTTASFEPFFQEWYTKDYFPQVSQKLQRELQDRAQKQQNVFDSLASQFKGWIMGKTESLHAAALYQFVVKYTLPPAYGHWFFLRTATVNLGSRTRPAYITFWGLNESWMLAPYIRVDFENTSLLDELERQTAAG